VFEDKIRHATFRLPKPEVHPPHPLRDPENRARLLDYLRARLDYDRPNRDSRVEKYSQLDRDVSAWMKMSDDDRKRAVNHAKTGKPQATQVSLPLVWVHLDDMMTYFAQTFAPNRGMFYHTAQPEDSQSASQLVALMNNHAIYGGYYRQLLRAIFQILKYNVGGLTSTWAVDYGPKLEMGLNGEPSLGIQPVFKGNKVRAIDMYNLFYDPSVELSQLHQEGEWFATAEMRSHYWLKNKCLEGVYFNCDEMLDGDCTSAVSYYKNPPVEARLDTDQSSGVVNWINFVGGGATDWLQSNAFELVTVYVRINPNDFGLVPGDRAARAARNHYETWRFTLTDGGQKLIQAQHMNNIHGYLPAFFGVINDDFMGDAAKSPAEILNPLQQFSSFLLNAHVAANRRNLYGTTFYDPSRVDYGQVPEGEVAARVPVKPQGQGQDIRTMVYHDNNPLDTKQTLQDLEGMIGIIDRFFPAQALPSQIAGIDRAVSDQVAAVQQGTNRRQQKSARLLDDTMMRPLRFSMYYNIVQYQEDGVEVADFFDGTTRKVDLSSLRDVSLVHLIGQGLKALDRQQAAGQMSDVIFAMIQAPQASQQIDILKMLDYWMSMMDVDVNMQQFALPPPPAGAPATPGMPAGAPINPATDPAVVAGGPIYD